MNNSKLATGYRALKDYRKELKFFSAQVDAGILTIEQAKEYAISNVLYDVKQAYIWADRIETHLGFTPFNNHLSFLTIRPNDKLITIKEFIEDCRTFFLSSRIKSFHYVFEQKGDNLETLGKGFHCHAIVEWVESPAKLLKFATIHFKRYTAANCIQLGFTNGSKRIQNNDELERIKKYIGGDKKDESKKPATEYDKIFREKYKILTAIKSGSS